MIIKHELSDGVWEWDSHIGRWSRPRYKKEEPKNIPAPTPKPKKNLLVDWKNWNEYLLALYKSARSSTGWPNFLLLHDVSDNRFFDILEFHYKNGTLKLEE